MKRWAVSTRITIIISFGLVGALLGAGLLSANGNRILGDANTRLGVAVHSDMTAAILAGQFQRELLTSRLQFVQYVKRRPAGASEAGWTHYQNAEKVLSILTENVNEDPNLLKLRPLVEQLNSRVCEYRPMLSIILDGARDGRNQEESFQVLLKDWISLSAQIVDIANECEGRGSDLASHATSSIEVKNMEPVAVVPVISLGALVSGMLPFIVFRSRVKSANRGPHDWTSVFPRPTSSSQRDTESSTETVAVQYGTHVR